MSSPHFIVAYLTLCNHVPQLRVSETTLRVVKGNMAYCTTRSPRLKRWRVNLETNEAEEVRK